MDSSSVFLIVMISLVRLNGVNSSCYSIKNDLFCENVTKSELKESINLSGVYDKVNILYFRSQRHISRIEFQQVYYQKHL